MEVNSGVQGVFRLRGKGTEIKEKSSPVKVVHPSSYRFSMVMNSYSVISILSYLIFTGVFALTPLLELSIFSAVCLIVWLVIHLVIRKGYRRAAFAVGIFITTVFSLLLVISLGWASGFFFGILVVIPLIFINARLPKLVKSLIGVILGAIVIMVYYFSLRYLPFWTINPQFLELLYVTNLVISILVLSFFGYFFELSTSTAEASLVKANQKLMNLATTDPVTNLLNRRNMMVRIEQEKDRLDRGGKPFSLVMVDIDNFKQINDEYGHDGGDFVLVMLAQMVSVSLRKQDQVARWGGDEFLIFLPETNLDGGRIVAEKIRSRILRSPFVYREMDIPVTLTFGVGNCDEHIGIGSCIRKADQALYQGKQAGKNRVVIIE